MMTEDSIKRAFIDAIKETHVTCYPDEHREFINTWIEKEQRNQESWEAIKVFVLGSSIIGGVSWIGYAVAHFLGIPVLK